MGSTENSVTPSSTTEPPPFSLGSSPPSDALTGTQVPEQIGWPGSPNLSLPEKTETPAPAQDADPAPTVPAAPAPASDVAPIIATPAATVTPASGAPDFSWLQSPSSPPAAPSPPQFSFGTLDQANNLPEHSTPGISVSPPATAFGGTFAAPAATSRVALQPEPNSPAPNVFGSFTPPAGHGSPSPSAGAWETPGSSSPPPAFSLDPTKIQAPTAGFDASSFGAAARTTQSTESDPPSLSRSNPTTPVAAELSREQAASGQPLISMAMLILGSYASLVTICLLYLLLFMRKHQLESLPDLKTVQQLGGRATVPRPENFLPAGHELRIGQSERFGNIRVTPLRVTRAPIVFTHYSGDTKQTRSPTEPVLKLWLKFENVSTRQTIAPLDTTLMFFNRAVNDHVASYNVIFREADRKQRKAQFYYPFDRMSAESEWTMVGQHTNESLAPGESFETYIPSEENTEGLKGDVIWRVHFRKGHGFMTGNGVTTLIDVRFNTDDVKSESA